MLQRIDAQGKWNAQRAAFSYQLSALSLEVLHKRRSLKADG
jgi:hypothetical protein